MVDGIYVWGFFTGVYMQHDVYQQLGFYVSRPTGCAWPVGNRSYKLMVVWCAAGVTRQVETGFFAWGFAWVP